MAQQDPEQDPERDGHDHEAPPLLGLASHAGAGQPRPGSVLLDGLHDLFGDFGDDLHGHEFSDFDKDGHGLPPVLAGGTIATLRKRAGWPSPWAP